VKRILTVLGIISICFSADATHLISHELTYQYLGDSIYKVQVEYGWWCGGTMYTQNGPFIQSSINVQYSCPGSSGNNGLLLTLKSLEELPIYSASGQAQNSCGSGGSSGFTGYKIATYDTIINMNNILPGCDNPRFHFLSGARVGSVNVIGQPSYFTWVDLDLQNQIENSSTQSFRFDIPGALLDSSNYSFSVAKYDSDGDSLTYEFDTVWAGTNNIAYYNSGYSFSTPVPSLTLNSQTGQIDVQTEIPTGYDFAPYIVNIRTDEWDPETGTFRGSTYRDVVFYVLPYANNVNPDFQNITNVTAAQQTDTFYLRVCARDTFSFDVSFTDPDASDTLFVSSNLEFIADYYNVTQTGINPTTATITAVINKTYNYGFDAIVKAMDSHNPMIGQTSKRIHIRSVGPANETVYACYNNWDTISTTSDSISNWSVISGDTISASNFICMNTGCTQASLHSFNNTTYLVENFMTGGCSFYDTITVLTDTTLLIGQAIDSSSNAVINSKVYRFQYDSGLDSVYVIDSTVTDASGYFSFGLGIDSFLLKVSPDSSAYPMLMPTYYDGQTVVPSADFIYPDYCDTLDIIHELVAGSNPGGPGFISGIVSQGAGRAVGDPVSGVVIVLMDGQQKPIDYRTTNSLGEFRFEGLTNDDYAVNVDRWGIKNEIAPIITLTAESNEIDSLQFILYSDRLELTKNTGVREFDQDPIQLFPNPTSDILNVVSVKTISNVSMFDQSGRLRRELNPMSMRFQLSVRGMSNGIYFVELMDVSGALHHSEVVILR
jgi:hypothetical protein